MRSISPRSGTTLTHTLCAQRASTVVVGARAQRTMAQRRVDASDVARRTPAGTSVKTRLEAESQGGDGVRPNVGHVPSTSTGGNTSPVAVKSRNDLTNIAHPRRRPPMTCRRFPSTGTRPATRANDPRQLAPLPVSGLRTRCLDDGTRLGPLGRTINFGRANHFPLGEQT